MHEFQQQKSLHYPNLFLTQLYKNTTKQAMTEIV